MKNIYQTIIAVLTDLEPIGKEKRNQKQGFMYRGVDDVMNALAPLFAKHSLFVVPETLEQTREERKTSGGGNLIYSIVKMRFTFYAEDGSSVTAVTIGEGMDSGDKATNKAMAIAFKYACFQVFCIPTEETMPDPDKNTPDLSTPMHQDDKQQPKQKNAAPVKPEPIEPYKHIPNPSITKEMLENLYALAAFKGKTVEDVEKASNHYYRKPVNALSVKNFKELEERLNAIQEVAHE